jgi:hypothetical protein
MLDRKPCALGGRLGVLYQHEAIGIALDDVTQALWASASATLIDPHMMLSVRAFRRLLAGASSLRG